MSSASIDSFVVAVSSSALFDTSVADAAFNAGGEKAFIQHQIDNEDVILSPGPAMPVIKALLAANAAIKNGPRIKIIILSHNTPAASIREGLSEQELALFDLLLKNDISKADRERLKQASRELLAALRERLTSMPNWTKNTTTQADVKILVLDTLYQSLPRPPFTEEETEALADRLYGFIWQRSEAGSLFTDAA